MVTSDGYNEQIMVVLSMFVTTEFDCLSFFDYRLNSSSTCTVRQTQKFPFKEITQEKNQIKIET